jgi:regulator of protease activity HflC (stomatin/prohibitin superfamily)
MSITLKIVLSLFAIGLLLGGFIFGCERIDAGYTGVRVELYGTDRGVQDIEVVTGMVWYNRFTTAVYEFPTFVQHKVWTKDNEFDRNEEFTVTTKDAMALSFDVGFQFSVVPDSVSDIFKKYRRPLTEILNTYIRTAVRNSYNMIAGKMTAEEILSYRSEYEDGVRGKLDSILNPDGIVVNQVAIIGKIRTPSALEEAINAKITAVQNAQRAENEKQQTIAEASKQIESAKGDSASTIIRARAEAEANRLRQISLTPIIIQKELINKWDGKLPMYGMTPQLFREVSK